MWISMLYFQVWWLKKEPSNNYARVKESECAVCSKIILIKLYTSLPELRKDPLIIHSRRHPTTQRVLDKFHTTVPHPPTWPLDIYVNPPHLCSLHTSVAFVPSKNPIPLPISSTPQQPTMPEIWRTIVKGLLSLFISVHSKKTRTLTHSSLILWF